MLAHHGRVIGTPAVRCDPSRAVVGATDRPVRTINHPDAAGLTYIRHTESRPTIGCTSITIIVVSIVARLDSSLNVSIAAARSVAIV